MAEASDEQTGGRTEAERVEAWRLHCLLAAGYELVHASALCAADVDLHLAVALVVEKGCPPATAVRILL